MYTTVYGDIAISYVDSLSIHVYTFLVANERHFVVHGCVSVVALAIVCYTWNY